MPTPGASPSRAITAAPITPVAQAAPTVLAEHRPQPASAAEHARGARPAPGAHGTPEPTARLRSTRGVDVLPLDETLRRRLVAFARRFVRDAHEAEDVAQEALLRARDGVDELRTDERAEAWVFRICRHAAIDLVRMRKVRRGVWASLPAEAEEQIPARGPVEAEARPEAGVQAHSACDLTELPAHQRVLLGLHALAGRGQPELCRRTGLSASALRVRLYRARRQLLRDASSAEA